MLLVLFVATRAARADVTLVAGGQAKAAIFVTPALMAEDVKGAIHLKNPARETELQRERLRDSVKDLAAYLEKMISDRNLAAEANGTPEDWANESWAAARRALPKSPLLAIDYYETNIKVVDKRLALAGLRLAKVLNETLDQAKPPLKPQ